MKDEKEMDEIEFFGPIDRNDKGRIVSEYPAYYNEAHVDSLKESVDQKERALESGLIPQDARPQYLASQRMDKEKLEKIMESKPKLSDVQKDSLARTHKQLGEKIRESMFTYTEMTKGTADAHEEAHRMEDPVIPITKDEARLAAACGIPVSGGKISRNQASRIWKIAGNNLGENTNVEILRPQK